MGIRAEALASRFEAKAREMTAVVERVSEADWKKTTAAERWPVGVVAHHIAVGHQDIGRLIQMIAAGQPLPHLTMEMIHAANARHAREQAGCTRPATLAVHGTNAGAPPVSAGQLAGAPRSVHRRASRQHPRHSRRRRIGRTNAPSLGSLRLPPRRTLA